MYVCCVQVYIGKNNFMNNFYLEISASVHLFRSKIIGQPYNVHLLLGPLDLAICLKPG